MSEGGTTSSEDEEDDTVLGDVDLRIDDTDTNSTGSAIDPVEALKTR